MQTVFEQKTDCVRQTAIEPSRIIKPAKALKAILLLVLLYYSVPALNATYPDSFSIALTWDAIPSPKVIGYRVYYGTTSGKYSKSVKVGKVTTAAVARLVRGVTYFFAVTSCGKNGLESSFSHEISYVRSLPAVSEKAKLDKLQRDSTRALVGIGVTGSGQPVLTVQGLTGQTYYLLAAQTATDWAVIGIVKLDTNGWAEFIDTNTASFQQRFYRAEQKP